MHLVSLPYKVTEPSSKCTVWLKEPTDTSYKFLSVLLIYNICKYLQLQSYMLKYTIWINTYLLCVSPLQLLSSAGNMTVMPFLLRRKIQLYPSYQQVSNSLTTHICTIHSERKTGDNVFVQSSMYILVQLYVANIPSISGYQMIAIKLSLGNEKFRKREIHVAYYNHQLRCCFVFTIV